MEAKQVWRYKCEHCGKTGYSKGHMRKHERRCTMNPDRTCGVCIELLKQDQPDLATLSRLLPDKDAYLTVHPADKYGCVESVEEHSEILNAVLPAIMAAAGGCPNCTAAVFRQAGIHLPSVTDFKWKEELQRIWAPINQEGNCDGWY